MGSLSSMMSGSIYLDTNVFVYWLEGYAAFSRALADIFVRMSRGEHRGVTSELSLAECLVKPMMDGNLSRQAAFQEAIVSSDGLLVQPVSREVLIEAARVRAALRLTLPNAVHVATAHLTGCQASLANDDRLRTPAGMTVITLGDLD